MIFAVWRQKILSPYLFTTYLVSSCWPFYFYFFFYKDACTSLKYSSKCSFLTFFLLCSCFRLILHCFQLLINLSVFLLLCSHLWPAFFSYFNSTLILLCVCQIYHRNVNIFLLDLRFSYISIKFLKMCFICHIFLDLSVKPARTFTH